jgi:hypothetical protein
MVKIVGRLVIVIALAGASRSFALERPSDIPAWLAPNVGGGEGQIAQVVLQWAGALYFQKVRASVVRNPCYFAMDATRPHDLSDGELGPRCLRIRPVVPCDFSGSWRRPRFEGQRGFRQRKAVREELRQCAAALNLVSKFLVLKSTSNRSRALVCFDSRIVFPRFVRGDGDPADDGSQF